MKTSIEIVPELVLHETNESTIPYFERSFNYDSWKSFTLKYGSVIIDLLRVHQALKEIRGLTNRRCRFKINSLGS
ncbi:5720_t:CDS:2 [Funneliformis mosseae]|uniref:5720_t:CDS:1 n=1 Tax=Funneliformis mosseae TaxID=27381 RepID=A0A9N9D1T0_FUNMO|nr:5720_t:CDS:2 [Funneliformis mosseae]